MSVDEYAKVVEALVKFNALGGDPELNGLNLLPGFDDETWTWERNLFRKYCLGARFARACATWAAKLAFNLAPALQAAHYRRTLPPSPTTK